MNDNQPIEGQVTLAKMPKQFERPAWTIDDESDFQTRTSDGAASLSWVSEIHHFDSMDRDGALQPKHATVYLCKDIYLTIEGIEDHKPYVHIDTEGDPYFTADQARAFANKVLEMAMLLEDN